MSPMVGGRASTRWARGENRALHQAEPNAVDRAGYREQRRSARLPLYYLLRSPLLIPRTPRLENQM